MPFKFDVEDGLCKTMHSQSNFTRPIPAGLDIEKAQIVKNSELEKERKYFVLRYSQRNTGGNMMYVYAHCYVAILKNWPGSQDELRCDYLDPRPKIGGDEKELADILRQDESLIVSYSGNSGFAARNRYRISKKEKSGVKLPLLIVGEYTPKKIREILGEYDYRKYEFYTKNSIFFPEFESELLSDSDVLEIETKIIVARKKLQEKENENFVKKFSEASQDGGYSAVMLLGGKEEFSSAPERFRILAMSRHANTADHRQNLVHTYQTVILDKEKIVEGATVVIVVPDQLKGLVIGKGGVNIKKICQELRCHILIK